jgi:hypothetical protein
MQAMRILTIVIVMAVVAILVDWAVSVPPSCYQTVDVTETGSETLDCTPLQGPLLGWARPSAIRIGQFVGANAASVTALSATVLALLVLLLGWSVAGLKSGIRTQRIETQEALRLSGAAAAEAGRSVNAIEQALIASQRAFVFLRRFEVEVLRYPDRAIIVPVWENSGATPTKNMRSHVNWSLRKDSLGEEFHFPDFAGGESIGVLIGPRSTVNATALEISAEDLDEVIERRGHLYVWGWAEYNDVYLNTPRHRTEFCNEVIISRDVDRRVAVNFAVYKKHNSADDGAIKTPRQMAAG